MMVWGIRISWVKRLLQAGSAVDVGFRFAWNCFPSALEWKGALKCGWLVGGLAACVFPGGNSGADGSFSSAESVTCHKDRMDVQFSRELGNYSWHVYIVGMYCYCPDSFCCILKTVSCL